MSDEGEVERLRKQVTGLSRFGTHALRERDLDALLQEASQLVSRATGIKLVKVLELLPGGNTMLVRAGVNWNPGGRRPCDLRCTRELTERLRAAERRTGHLA